MPYSQNKKHLTVSSLALLAILSSGQARADGCTDVACLDKRVGALELQIEVFTKMVKDAGLRSLILEASHKEIPSYDNSGANIVDSLAATIEENAKLNARLQEQQKEIGEVRLTALASAKSNPPKGFKVVKSAKYPDAVIFERKNKDGTYTCSAIGLPNRTINMSTFGDAGNCVQVVNGETPGVKAK